MESWWLLAYMLLYIWSRDFLKWNKHDHRGCPVTVLSLRFIILNWCSAALTINVHDSSYMQQMFMKRNCTCSLKNYFWQKNWCDVKKQYSLHKIIHNQIECSNKSENWKWNRLHVYSKQSDSHILFATFVRHSRDTY